jgi:mRNA-degrading endonuclease toxin of MazEF toxin-antitoxin module
MLRAGDIVIADWRADAVHREPNKLRPAIVVQDEGLFGPSYPNVIVVPITGDEEIAIPDLTVAIDPTPENGCVKRSFALAPFVTCVSKTRLRETGARIAPTQLTRIRRQIAEAIGIATAGED